MLTWTEWLKAAVRIINIRIYRIFGHTAQIFSKKDVDGVKKINNVKNAERKLNFKSPLEVLTVARNQFKLKRLERLIIFKAFESIRENQDKLQKVKLFINSIPNQTLSESDLWQLRTLMDGCTVEINSDGKKLIFTVK